MYICVSYATVAVQSRNDKCKHVCINACLYMLVCIHICARICLCVCFIYIYIYIYIYICIVYVLGEREFECKDRVQSIVGHLLYASVTYTPYNRHIFLRYIICRCDV